jgi:metallophosphoesterase (TIGR03768 family)
MLYDRVNKGIMGGEKMKSKKIFSLVLTASLIVTQMYGGVGFAEETNDAYPNPYVVTTVETTIVPKDVPKSSLAPLPNDVENYTKQGYGITELKEGLKIVKREDILPVGYTPPTKEGNRLLRFFTMSDIHIADIQSPAQVLVMGEKPIAGMSSAYSPTILYSTQVLDAAVRSVNKVNASNKLDFGIMLGDAINSAQKNELNMYLDVLTGRTVNPNSDLTKKVETDYMQPFKAEGLNIPWYQVLGNHDHFWSGVYDANDKLKKALVGDTIMRIGLAPNSKALDGEDIYGGIIDVSTKYGKIMGSGLSNGNDADTHKIVPNVDRQFLDAKAFVNMFPSGHGLKLSTSEPVACYTFEPKSNVPVRVIVLDNTAKQDEKFLDPTANSKIATNAANASLDKVRFEWLKKELKLAQDQGKLIIVATHIPVGMKGLWSVTSQVSEEQFINELHKYSNMSLLLAGHRHLNTIIPYPSEDPKKPEYGFWQVETASLRDFAQQFRLFDINVNNNGTISIITTNVDPLAEKGSAMEKSRSYAIATSQIFPEPRGLVLPPEKSRANNAELYKKLSPEMNEKLTRKNVLIDYFKDIINSRTRMFNK